MPNDLFHSISTISAQFAICVLHRIRYSPSSVAFVHVFVFGSVELDDVVHDALLIDHAVEDHLAQRLAPGETHESGLSVHAVAMVLYVLFIWGPITVS